MKKRQQDSSTSNDSSEVETTNPTLDGQNPQLGGGGGGGGGGLDPKLTAMRAGLHSDEARAMFDERVKALGDRAVRAMEGMSRGQGGLEASLLKMVEARDKAATTSAPFGAALDQVEELKQRATQLLRDLDADPMPGSNFLPEQVPNSGSAAWLPKIRTELKHLEKIESGKREADVDFVRGIRNNLEGIAAEHADAQKMGDGTLVNNDITYSGGTLDIDNISADGSTWSEVKNKEPFGLGSSNWSEEIAPKARKMKQAASEDAYKDTVKTLRFSFPKGVSTEVKASLETMGFEVDGPVRDP